LFSHIFGKDEHEENLLISMFLLAACAPQATTSEPAGPQTITVMTHDSFSVSEDVVAF
jgi:uncharacterized lipoprotein YajG